MTGSSKKIPFCSKEKTPQRKRVDSRSQQHGSLKIVRDAVLKEVVDDDGRQEEDDRLENLKVQRHGLADDPAEDDEEGRHEQGDLQAAAEGDADGEVHLALARDDDGRNVLGRVADHRDQDQADKGLADVRRLDQGVDAVDQELGAHRHDNRHEDEREAGGPRTEHLPVVLLFLLLRGLFDASFGFVRVGLVEEVQVSLQLEVEVEHVERQQDDGRPVRQDHDLVVQMAAGLMHGGVQRGRDDERRRRNGHQGRHGRSHRRVESLSLSAPSANGEATSEDLRRFVQHGGGGAGL